MLRRLVREPLVHFLVLGAHVLRLSSGAGRDSPISGDTEIVVTQADIDRIAAGFATTWQRPPSDTELQGAINDYVREEVLYRAGLRLGLDKDDTIVRRRIRQKMEFFFEDTVGTPTGSRAASVSSRPMPTSFGREPRHGLSSGLRELEAQRSEGGCGGHAAASRGTRP